MEVSKVSTLIPQILTETKLEKTQVAAAPAKNDRYGKQENKGLSRIEFEELVDNIRSEYPINTYLARYGCNPVGDATKNKLYYLSPIRDGETTPSFVVDLKTRMWKDYGSGDFGDIIELAMRFFSIPFWEAVDDIRQHKSVAYSENKQIPAGIGTDKEKAVHEIVKVKEAVPKTSRDLMRYAAKRGISPIITKTYLKAVFYRVNDMGQKNSGRPYFSLAMQNQAGSWELNNEVYDSKIKKTIGKKFYSVFEGYKPTGGLNIFEGIFDFLAAIEHHRKTHGKEFLQLPSDSIILHGTALLEKVADQLKVYDYINAYFNNDPYETQTGQKAFNRLEELHPKVFNRSATLYPNFNDFNDFWVHEINPKSIRHEPDLSNKVNQHLCLFKAGFVWKESVYDSRKNHLAYDWSRDKPSDRKRGVTAELTFEEAMANYIGFQKLMRKVDYALESGKAKMVLIYLNTIPFGGKDKEGNQQYGLPFAEFTPSNRHA